MNARITALYGQARKGLAEGDAGYWKAAEAMADLFAAGQSQREIAVGVGCSDTTVQRYLKIWSASRGKQIKPPFSEAMAEVRGDRSAEKLIPQTAERRAELAAELLKDKAVYDQPAVRKAVDQQVNRQLRQAATEWHRDTGVPTRGQKERDLRKLSPAINRIFWRDLLYAVNQASRLLGDAVSELDRTGLPDGQAGDIIRAARNLSRQGDRFVDAASGRAVGVPMGNGA